MLILNINEKTEEVRRLVQEGKTVKEAIEIVKGYSLTDQSIENNQNKDFNDIIAPGESIDNGQVILDETGEVLRDLI